MTSNRKEPLSTQVNDYATLDDFRAVFTSDIDELYQLSFLLTADHQKAEQCFLAGFEDSVKENHVFKEWARSWAKRKIIQNAIRKSTPRPLAPSFSLALPPYVVPLPSDQDRHLEIDAVLALEDFERFVFVMSVLEDTSAPSCSAARLGIFGKPEPRELRSYGQRKRFCPAKSIPKPLRS